MAALAVLVLIPWVVQAQSRDVGSDFILDAANGGRDHHVGRGLRGRQAVRLPDVGPDPGRGPGLHATRPGSGRTGPPCGHRTSPTASCTPTGCRTGAGTRARTSTRFPPSATIIPRASGRTGPPCGWRTSSTTICTPTGCRTGPGTRTRTSRWTPPTISRSASGRTEPPCGWWTGRTPSCTPTACRDRSRDAGKDFALDADDQSTEGLWSAGVHDVGGVPRRRQALRLRLEQSSHGCADDHRQGLGGRDSDGGHPLHRRRGRAGRRSLPLSMGVQRRERRHGHLGRDPFDLHHRPRRPRQDRQGQGVLHRRPGQRRVVYQRADGPDRGPGHLRPDACGDGSHRRRDDRRRRLLRGFPKRGSGHGPAPTASGSGVHARAAPAGERTVGPAGRGFPRPTRAARPGPQQKLPRDGPGPTLRRPSDGGGDLSVGKPSGRTAGRDVRRPGRVSERSGPVGERP